VSRGSDLELVGTCRLWHVREFGHRRLPESVGETATNETPKAFKSPAAKRILATSLVLAIALLIAGVASPKLHVIAPVFAVVNLAVGVRIWMMGVYLRSDAVRVVNFHSAKTLAWDEVERFEIAPLAQYRDGAYLVRTGDRGRIPIVALTGGRWGGGRAPQRSIEALNEALRIRRTDPNTSQGFVDSLR
jgi:hypothetical protein